MTPNDFHDTDSWWVLEDSTGWRIALNGANKSMALNVVTGQVLEFPQLIQKLYKVSEAESYQLIQSIIDAKGLK